MRLSTALSALDGSVTSGHCADAPLPVFGVHGTHRIGDKWRFVGDVGWFDVAAGDLQGTFMDALLALENDTFHRIDSLGEQRDSELRRGLAAHGRDVQAHKYSVGLSPMHAKRCRLSLRS